ncbi:hypothetical protein N9R79_06305 [Vibrio sp.]|nr:hypothetical protein [Vibrio sp.]
MLPLLVVDQPRSINRVHRNVFSYTRNDYSSISADEELTGGLGINDQADDSEFRVGYEFEVWF